MGLRKRVEELSRSSCIVNQALGKHKLGLCSYEEALEILVLALSDSEETLRESLIDIRSKGFPPIIIKVESHKELNKIYEETS